MHRGNFGLRTATLALLILVWAAPGLVAAEDAALTGVVSSEKEGPMEGVMVSAKRTGGTITVTVASDAQGRYSFPRSRLEPGSYSIRVRAIGYELEHPATADVSAQGAATVDLKLTSFLTASG
jgi:hypothetical protein